MICTEGKKGSVRVIQAQDSLGISDVESDQIVNDLTEAVRNTKTMDEAIRWLTDRYDAKAMLLGMQFMQVLQENTRLYRQRKAQEAAGKCGPKQNAEMN